MLQEQISKVLKHYVKLHEKLVIGVSGGVDSMVLLHVLQSLPYEIEVVHMDHGLRADAKDDYEFVEKYCARQGISFYGVRVQCPEGVNVEQWGREERYRTFEERRIQTKATAILTAHHQGDVVETVLMQLGRGASFAGLAGMNEWQDPLLRPMLHIRKEDIFAYAALHDLVWKEDPTNGDTTFRRNFVRKKLLPLWREQVPAIDERVVQLAEDAHEIREFVANQYKETTLFKQWSTAASANLEELRTLPRVLIHEWIFAVWEQCYGARKDLYRSHVDELYGWLMSAQDGKKPMGLHYDLLIEHGIVSCHSSQAERVAQKMLLTETLQWGPWTLQKESFEGTMVNEPYRLYLAIHPQEPLYVRGPKEGDRFHPLGAPGSKTIGDFLSDQKVPLSSRAHFPIIVSEADEICAVGTRPAEQYKITDQSLSTRITITPSCVSQ